MLAVAGVLSEVAYGPPSAFFFLVQILSHESALRHDSQKKFTFFSLSSTHRMVRREPPPVARGAAQMVPVELEAAEALAGLARSSSLRGRALVSRAEAVVDVVSASQSQVSYYHTYPTPP